MSLKITLEGHPALDLILGRETNAKARQRALDQSLYREALVKRDFAMGAALIKMGADPLYDYQAENGLAKYGATVGETALTLALHNLPLEPDFGEKTLLADLGLFFDAAFASPNLNVRFALLGGTTPLMLAIRNDNANTRHLRLVERLVPLSEVDAADNTEHTALMHALIYRHKDACALLAPVSNIERRNCSGKTTLELALELAGANRPHFEKEKQELLDILIAETERRELMKESSIANGISQVKAGLRI